MVRSRSDIYSYFDVEGKKAICKYCKKEAFKNPSRMPVHLVKCSKCPESVKTKVAGTISKSCVALCKSSPVFKTLELKSKMSPNYVNSFSEERDLDSIDDIEVLTEDDVENDELYLHEEKFKYVNPEKLTETWRRKSAEEDRLQPKQSEEFVSDEFSKFGECVAHKLRNINNPRARAIAQYYINSVLFRAEMTNFEEKLPFASLQEFELFDKVQKDSGDSEDT